ncbi:MAG: hypothetical protein JKX76_14940 [Colwellia sp.]|nr:hypothetical protein [Colwellia sp.]
MIEIIINYIIPISGAVTLACFVGYINWRSSFKVRRANACAIFRDSIMSELGSIYPQVDTWPDDIDSFLRHRFTALQVTIENYRPFVSWWKRGRFDAAWFRYRCSTGREIDTRCYHHYMSFEDNPNYKIIFYKNVHRILKFANET